MSPVPCLRQMKTKKAREFRANSATPSREEKRETAAWEGSLAYGDEPNTVAGPRPNRTAFPAALACKL